jgi:hypothetical protein
MSKTSEHGKVPLPPLDEDGNPIVVEDVSNTETSTAPTVEELMKKLSAELKKLKTKDKKGKKKSSSSEDDDSSFEEKVSYKARRERKKHDKSSYNVVMSKFQEEDSSESKTCLSS